MRNKELFNSIILLCVIFLAIISLYLVPFPIMIPSKVLFSIGAFILIISYIEWLIIILVIGELRK